MQQHKAEKMQEEARLQQALLISEQQHKAEKVQEEARLQQALLISKQQKVIDRLLSEQQRQKSRFEKLESKVNSVPKKQLPQEQTRKKKKARTMSRQEELTEEATAWASGHVNAVVAPIIHVQKQPPIPKPKKANNAFFIFMNANRARIMENNPTFAQPEFVSLSVMGCLFVFAMFFPHTDTLYLSVSI